MSALDSRLTRGDRSATPTRAVSRRAFGVAVAVMIAVMAGPALAAKPDKAAKPGKGPNGPTLLPLRFDEVVVENGQLVAIGQLGGEVVRAPLTLALAEEQPAGAECPILDLALGPISLDLLGLNVDTSAICLNIAAEPGPGNLLGNLLCGIGGLLDDGLPLGGILGRLTAAELTALLDGLTDLLNAALTEVTAPTSFAGVSNSPNAAQMPAGECDILNLELGPINLNLLGLDVDLDNCEGGAITVDITAVPGAGNLLGNLLCEIVGLFDGGIIPDDVNVLDDKDLRKALNRVAKAIRKLT